MIKIKNIPNILNKAGRKQKTFKFIPGKSVSKYLSQSKFSYKGQRIIISSRSKPLEDLSYIPNDGDEIIITPDVKFAALAVWWAAATFWQGVVLVAGILTTAYAIYSAVTTKTSTPNFGTAAGEGMDESSPTYGWDGISITQEVGIPIAIVYGEHKVGGNIVNQYVRTDGDKQFLNLLVSLGEGEIQSISDVKVNDNPNANFEDIELTYKYGTNDQTVIANFQDLHNINPLNVQLLKNSAYVYTTVKTDIEAFELTFNCINGLYQAGSEGGVSSWAVTYQVEYKLVADGSYTDLGSTTIDGMTRTTLRRIFRKDGLTAGQYDIRITKTSDNVSLSPVKEGDLYLKVVDEITTEDLAYPNVALLGVEALATEQLSGGVPNITCVVKGRKITIPKIMYSGDEVAWADYYWEPSDTTWRRFSDGVECTWDGTTYVDRWCANPIWCLKDLMTNKRYGIGELIATTELDSTVFLAMAKYCDERVSNGAGGYEKRNMLDCVIDSYSSALDIITQICSTFRGFAFFSNGTIKLSIDNPTDPVQLFGMGNIIMGSYSETWKPLREIPNIVEVLFMDRNKDWAQETIAIVNEVAMQANDPIRKVELRLFVTRMSQAIREGKYAMNLANLINRSISFKAGIEAIACTAGDIISVSHDVPQWGFSGTVQANSTKSKVYLDRDIVLEVAKTYKIAVRLSDDTIEERTITTLPGTVSSVDVSPVFTGTPTTYDRYAIGESGIQTKPFRIVSLSRSGDGEVEISALEYDADVYSTDVITLPTNNYSALDNDLDNVENLSLTEHLVKLGDGTIENCIDVWFNKPFNSSSVLTIDKVKIYYSDNAGGSWIYAGETYGENFTISGGLKDGTEYTVAVVPVSLLGTSKTPATSLSDTITLVGKTAPPGNVSGFIVMQSRDRLFFSWSQVADVDLNGYEVRYGISWDAGIVIATYLKSTSLITLDFREGASQSFWVKAIDTSINYSATATEGIITIANIPFTNVIISYSEQTAFAATKVNMSVVSDKLEIDAGNLTGTYTTAVRDLGYVATFKVGIETVVTIGGSGAAWDDFPGLGMDDMGSMRFSGAEAVGAVAVQIKTSSDNIIWSAYSNWIAGDYTCKYFQLQFTFTRTDLSQDLECSAIDYYADLPDVDEFGVGEVTVAASGDEIVFTKTFHEIPGVNIDIVSGDGYVHKFSTVPSTTGFIVKLYALDGTTKTGDFRYHAHGV